MEIYSNYYCSSEWHFARLKGKGAHHAAILYSFALHLSKKSGIFSASIPRLAEYLGVDEKTVRKAIRLLVDIGFFVKVSEEPGATVRYRPVKHREWEARNPGRCTEKLEMPWANEPGQDTLGVELYAISGERYRPWPNFIKGMRNTGHSDAAIREHFREYLELHPPVGKQWQHGFTSRFMKYLKTQPLLCSEPSQQVPVLPCHKVQGVPLPQSVN